jgi:hypothetical protein
MGRAMFWQNFTKNKQWSKFVLDTNTCLPPPPQSLVYFPDTKSEKYELGVRAFRPCVLNTQYKELLDSCRGWALGPLKIANS